ncbi:hypothetical protein [Altericroceibacterium endophyticum]|uniref:MBL fold metallo-hydrolase n=1 Tax=Altericroceibacterium endophyticum TaxID=1808508 RepID=A0A6I4T3D5_9SPHN|nr:hypothetical protein [Altericroceibacterium endophyticum]MXO64769.1 hypothetical protein [Altericroceibacterium endophyticum]
MSETITRIDENFWNIRGKFKIAGMLDVGTQASLIRLPSGKFLFLDSYSLTPDMQREIYSLTEGGKAVEAILNLHPFHTLHCDTMAAMFPQAKLYGSARHKRKCPDLKWETPHVESQEVCDLYGDVLDFTLPRGVDYISDDENVHFSSLMAYHKPSRTIHVDDTLTYFDLPKPISLILPSPKIGFHPTLAKALEQRPGAARDFLNWAQDMAKSWHDATTICAAHSGIAKIEPESFPQKISEALEKLQGKLEKHRAKFG